LASNRPHRRLAAILAADVADYSRLMAADEDGTHAKLMAHLHALGTPKIEEHDGRVIKTTGDGFLAEFASAVEAVNCAVEIQRGMADRNSDIPREERLEFRMGINVGNIIQDGGDIFGDGVNVAARLESIAERGGICISRQVLDQIDGKVQLDYREMGRQNLKNISRPIEVFSVAIDESTRSIASRVLARAKLKQDIRHCKTSDGVRLAYATVGSGPPLVRSAHWLGHLEYDWEFPSSATSCWALQRISRSFATTRGAMVFRTGTSRRSRWTLGSRIWRRWSTRQALIDSRYVVSRKDAPFPSPLLSVTLNAFLI
jgi:class 3 adenylate cyclase